MHAQAVGEALSGSESGDDGDLSGLAAAMGRLRGASAQHSRGTDTDTEGSEQEDGDAATDEDEGSDAGEVRGPAVCMTYTCSICAQTLSPIP
jgi:hypothetical protein